ncbi:hypothetical protein DFR29_12223 [Tahibacter aquaticus]|uniref:Uncharacterized protein n=1 Tax=Tahibacter aquaticus TaxID=520092 RepID=A0A4R6YLU0_9GAMM|nr:hypothetical protein [Tahibacter aquaticus]TDR38223.1 hypothetical protein DFR29_12223 [Tahibacter aquaticus]
MQTAMLFRTTVLLAALLLAGTVQAQFDATTGTPPDRLFRHGIDGRPVSGQIVVNGYPMPFPAGSYVNGAQQASPAVYGGQFSFPASTLQSNVNGLGLVTLTTRLQNMSGSYNPLVGGNLAGLQIYDVYLQLQSATVSGIPVSLGSDCRFGPFLVSAQGSWNATTATVSETGFTIPPVAPTACNGYGATLSNSIAGSNNSITVNIAL